MSTPFVTPEASEVNELARECRPHLSPEISGTSVLPCDAPYLGAVQMAENAAENELRAAELAATKAADAQAHAGATNGAVTARAAAAGETCGREVQSEEPGSFEHLTRVCKPQSLPPEGDAMPHAGVAVTHEKSAAELVTGTQEMSSPIRLGVSSTRPGSHLGISDSDMRRFENEADQEDAAHTAVVARMALMSQLMAMVVMVLYFALGVLFYMFVEDWAALEALYFVVVTGRTQLLTLHAFTWLIIRNAACAVTTVGYGDVVPVTSTAKLFTCFFMFTYIGLIGVAFGMREANNAALLMLGTQSLGSRLNDSGSLEAVVVNSADDQSARDDESKIVGWIKIAKILLLAFMPSIVVVFSGAFFFMRENELSFTDAVYFSCVSQTTVGYGDISPATDNGR